VNGKTITLGDKADFENDSIKINGKLLTLSAEPLVYFAFYKPRGVLAKLKDTEKRPTLEPVLKLTKSRVFPIGSLSMTAEGLLLLTNDGKITEDFLKNEKVPQVFEVKVKGFLDDSRLKGLERGIKSDRGGFIRPHTVRIEERLTSKTVLEIAMLGPSTEDLKELFDKQGFLVERVKRTWIGQIGIGEMQAGGLRPLKVSQLQALLQPELGLKRLENLKEKDRLKKERTDAYHAKHDEKVGEKKGDKLTPRRSRTKKTNRV
jgi:pseudouridine synthase